MPAVRFCWFSRKTYNPDLLGASGHGVAINAKTSALGHVLPVPATEAHLRPLARPLPEQPHLYGTGTRKALRCTRRLRPARGFARSLQPPQGKAAFADRHAYYGDPRVVGVPVSGLMHGPFPRLLRLDATCPPRMRISTRLIRIPCLQGPTAVHSRPAPRYPNISPRLRYTPQVRG